MTGWQLLTTAWDWDGSVVAGCALVAAGYLAAARFRLDRPALIFLGGVASVLLALVSPLDPLSDHYLFSAHMLQHVVLDMAAPALFVAGVSADLARRMLRVPLLERAERVLGHPAPAWLLGAGTLWLWHVPALYDATLASEGIHIFEHLTFLVTGTMFWWPVFHPLEERRLATGPALFYLSLGAVSNSLLGILFSLASTPFYRGYVHVDDELGALSLIRERWGLSPIDDQRLGGALMWVLGGVIFLWAILVVVARWYREPEEGTQLSESLPGARSET